MKKIIISTIISITTLLILSIVTSITISLLQYNKDIKVNKYIIQVISIVLFLFAGMIYGFINKKQGLIGSIAFILVYLIFLFIFNIFSNTSKNINFYFLFVIGKCLAYSFGAIISVNLKKN